MTTPAVTALATAVDRETAWLSAYSPTDGLPPLLKNLGGPWDVVQAYWPRTPATQKTAIYVTRTTIDDERVANIRIRPSYMFRLKCIWPVRLTAAGLSEAEQRNFDAAIALLFQRIRGLPFDKTHGGAFLSAGEVPRLPGPHAEYEDPEVTVDLSKELRCTVSYPADDYEVND